MSGAEKQLEHGTPVRFVDRVDDKDAQMLLNRLKSNYGHKKLSVCQRVDKNHVSLQDKDGRLIHLCASHDSFLLNTVFVEPL